MAFFPSNSGFQPATNLGGDGDHDDLYGGFDYSIDEPTATVVAGGAFGGASLAPVNPTGYNFNSMGKPPTTALRGAPPGTALRNGGPPGTALLICCTAA